MLKKLLAFALLLVMGAVLGGVWFNNRLSAPYRGFAEGEVFVELPAGTSVSAMASRLAAAGVVPDSYTFRLAARLAGVERQLKAGEYRFAEAASPRDVVSRVAKGDVFVHPLTFPEGLTVKEMSVVFERSGLGTASEFVRAAADGSLVAELDPDARTLEGYLFPDTYSLTRHAGAASTVATMVQRFTRAFDTPLRTAALEARLSPRELVTLASIVEKETASPDERPLVAAVYRNRLRIGMPLQCDPTVVYALMLAGRWRGNITKADLQIDSPYNTYRYPGLPPGPIAAPGRAALEAVVRPADVPFLYFVSRNDGTHAFASTLSEHASNVTKWQVQYFQKRRAAQRQSR